MATPASKAARVGSWSGGATDQTSRVQSHAFTPLAALPSLASAITSLEASITDLVAFNPDKVDAAQGQKLADLSKRLSKFISVVEFAARQRQREQAARTVDEQWLPADELACVLFQLTPADMARATQACRHFKAGVRSVVRERIERLRVTLECCEERDLGPELLARLTDEVQRAPALMRGVSTASDEYRGLQIKDELDRFHKAVVRMHGEALIEQVLKSIDDLDAAYHHEDSEDAYHRERRRRRLVALRARTAIRLLVSSNFYSESIAKRADDFLEILRDDTAGISVSVMRLLDRLDDTTSIAAHADVLLPYLDECIWKDRSHIIDARGSGALMLLRKLPDEAMTPPLREAICAIATAGPTLVSDSIAKLARELRGRFPAV